MGEYNEMNLKSAKKAIGRRRKFGKRKVQTEEIEAQIKNEILTNTQSGEIQRN